jgi:hypothetical protein
MPVRVTIDLSMGFIDQQSTRARREIADYDPA